MYAFESTNPQVIEIKSPLKNLPWKSHLVHVSAHKRVLGNGTVVMLANEAIVRSSVELLLLVAHLRVKIHLPADFVKQWQDH